MLVNPAWLFEAIEAALDEHKMLSIRAGPSYSVLWKKNSGIVNRQGAVHVGSPKRRFQGSALDGLPDATHRFALVPHLVPFPRTSRYGELVLEARELLWQRAARLATSVL